MCFDCSFVGIFFVKEAVRGIVQPKADVELVTIGLLRERVGGLFENCFPKLISVGGMDSEFDCENEHFDFGFVKK